MDKRGAIPRPVGSFRRSTLMDRTPPEQISEETDQTANTSVAAEDSFYQCEICLFTDNVAKVCCDICHRWSHFKCANVTSNIANADYWHCNKCQASGQGKLIDIDETGAVGGDAITATAASTKSSETVVELPVDDVNLSQVNLASSGTGPRRSSRSRKSKSTTSTSSKKKALALQRLEEEKQLQQLRDQEERARRDDERKEREVRDKEYLDKKYSILDATSDDSLSYDGYDDDLNPQRNEEIRRWAESVGVDLRDIAKIPYRQNAQGEWEMFSDEKVPQMSSTSVCHQKVQLSNAVDDPFPKSDSGKATEFIPLPPSSNAPASVQPATSRPVNTTAAQSFKSSTTSHIQAATSSYRTQPPNHQTVASNVQSAIMQQTNSNPTNNLASSAGYNATYPPISTNNSTFVLHNQPPSVTVVPSGNHTGGFTQPLIGIYQQPALTQMQGTTNHQPIMSSYHQPSFGQQSNVPNHQPIMSSYHQPSFGQQSNVPNHQPMGNYPQITSNASSVTSIPQSAGYRNSSHLTHQTALAGHYQTSSVSLPYQFGNRTQTDPSIPVSSGHQSSINWNTLHNSSLPVTSGHQSNYNMNQMNNASYGLNNTAGSVSHNNPIGVRQLTAEQIAARHVISKKLPNFYGDPEDWLTFISAYETSTTMCGYNNYENLGRLRDSLNGDAEDAVKSLLVHADAVPQIIHTLSMLYGRPELIIESMVQNIQKEPAPKDDDLASIMKFAIKVRNLSGTIRNTGALEHLRNPTLINSITDKLPTQIQLNWAYHKRTVGFTDLAVLGDWLNQIAEAASLVVRKNCQTGSRKKDQRDKNSPNSSSTKTGNYVNTQVESSRTFPQSPAKDKKCPACKNSSCTKLASCNKFKEINRYERSSIVKEYKLCTRCLGGHHFFRCRSNITCKVDGCTAKHHTLLHNPEKSAESPAKNELSSKSKDDQKEAKNSSDKFHSNASHVNASVSSRTDRIDIFRIVPIVVSHKNRSIHTYAYLDDGSNMTTMESDLATDLNLHGTSAPICVDWAFGYTHSVESKIVSVQIAGCFEEAEQFNLENVRTVKELHLPTQSISKPWLKQYHHLTGIPISTYESAKPRMLIGLQYSRLTVSLKTVEGSECEPLAYKTRLGWVVQGPSYNNTGQMSRNYSMNICECQSHDIKMHQLVKEYFLTENLGVKVSDAVLESKDIQRARQIMESTTSKTNGRYETGLLWKSDRTEMPDSYPMALKRLQCLEAKMARDPKLAENLRKQFKQFVVKGYIRKLTPEELLDTNDSRIWYLPTFPAFNPKKPEKVRIVWDGAAKVMNVSINSLLLTGPDQLVPLPDVLRRFRERLYAILGDIAEMFHQIKVIKADQNAQRFLWRDGDSSKPPEVYVMLVLTFGLTCSPSQAQYVKNRNAYEFIEKYPAAVNTIVKNHYVDDMIDSEHTIEAAEKRVKEVKYIHKQGGFEIRNFLSNSKELLRRIGEKTDAEQQSKNMNIGVELGTERVLGMFWNAATDCFTFSLKFNKINENILSAKQRPTKREVLRILMSVFDPLGLLANYLIYTKILLQEIWRSNVDWDEEVTAPVFKKWTAWIRTLPSVENIQIPRLYSPKLSPNPPRSIQQHIFVDASAEAYATAIYFRIEDDQGVDVCLSGAKTKVSPNKPMSIPRLELQGAVLGTRLATDIKSSQTFKIDKQVFWTDSQTVMGWINSEARKYNQFVAFRIGEILESTDPVEWRWIPSEHNVADEATKSKEIAKLDSSSRWYKGPKFLYENEATWFRDEGEIEYFTEEEIRPCFSMACREIVRPQLMDLERFSQWKRLVRAHAYVFRFIHNIRRMPQECRFGPLSQQEIRDAENHLYRRAQSDCFMDEIVILRHNQKAPLDKFKDLDKSSVIRTYSPYLDEHGVIRMKGRVDAAAALPYETKRPIILPRRHRVTKLIIDFYHRRYKHKNHFTALNEIRQKYTIPALRVVMKGIRASCQKCKNMLAEPKIPEMSELPPARLAAYTLPFTFVGVDYFGPLRVRNGRKTRNRPVIMEKRWVLLFTCLTTRAIWMEIAHSLDTNSCIMCIDNFMLRKGQPREIYSDNGSSFHSSEKELIAEFEKMNQKEIEEKFTNSDMIWKFNPPATPHMGGVWERLIRTVKSCLKETMLTRTPNDEMLKNLIVEAEYIVNSRPLTYVSLESADDEALTPNHILLGSSNGIKPLCHVTDKDLARNTYKAVQVLANNFFRRFVLEYMPTLTKRTKWFKPATPIKVGDVVVVVDETNERNTWPKGIVETLLPGKRGIVRQVMVRTARGVRRRSVGKLAVLVVPMGSVNGEGNVGHSSITVNTDLREFNSATGLPDASTN